MYSYLPLSEISNGNLVLVSVDEGSGYCALKGQLDDVHFALLLLPAFGNAPGPWFIWDHDRVQKALDLGAEWKVDFDPASVDFESKRKIPGDLVFTPAGPCIIGHGHNTSPAGVVIDGSLVPTLEKGFPRATAWRVLRKGADDSYQEVVAFTPKRGGVGVLF